MLLQSLIALQRDNLPGDKVQHVPPRTRTPGRPLHVPARLPPTVGGAQ